MKTKSPCALALAFSLSLMIVVPADISAEPQGAGQKAGEIARLIPAVSIARGSKTLNASVKTAVDWLDVVNTKADGRARIALEDGSVLNVGSDSSIKVVKHDAGAQQTDLELAYGKLRTQAQKISKPDGKFEVHTAAGVAGVVGTDFYVDYENNMMNVVAYEGSVRVCNLAGVCVMLKAGQMTNLRSNDNSAPAEPTQAPLNLLVADSKDTTVEPPPGRGPENVGHIGTAWGVTIGVLAVVPIVVFGVLASHHTNAPTPLNPCQINPANCG
jgi:hypothetical protein